MSVINQVLNQLEQRGAHTAAGQPMVRAVVHSSRNFAIPLLAIGLVLIAGIAAWQWASPRKPAVIAKSVAPKVVNSPSAYELEKLTPQKQFGASVVVPASGVSVVDQPDVSLVPASRLSLELSSVPLPASLRPGAGQSLRGGNNSSAANSVSASKSGKGAPVPAARTQIKPATTANAKAATQTSVGAVPMKQVSSAQQADAEFRRAAGLMQLGRVADAMAGYEAALRLDAGHDAARQALVALLLEGKRNADAERVLLEGLNSKPEHTGLTMLLARLVLAIFDQA